jgi:hypothetical protein
MVDDERNAVMVTTARRDVARAPQYIPSDPVPKMVQQLTLIDQHISLITANQRGGDNGNQDRLMIGFAHSSTRISLIRLRRISPRNYSTGRSVTNVIWHPVLILHTRI